MKSVKTLALLLVITTGVAGSAFCQQTVFSLLKNEVKLGDKYFRDGNFQGALALYRNAARKNPADPDVQLRLARCHYSLKQYSRSIACYDHYIHVKRTLPWSDLYHYAEAQAAVANYDTAITYYRKYLASDRDDELINKKIWRLSNVQYLYEDSSHYAVRPVSLNTPFGDLCATPYRGGVVFMSNRKEPQLVENVNASVNAPFYKLYFAGIISGAGGRYQYGKAAPFNKDFASRFNAGPVAFYDRYQKMVFVSTGDAPGAGGTRTLQLYFAGMQDGAWEISGSFPYNSTQYSISDPAISEDGNVLYFSSDMGGGFGKRDLYRSVFENEKWSRPENLGETINTPHDEIFPYLHQGRTLYFSSDGHPGLGGLDVFQAAIKTDGFSEPQNAGYPINSSYDDFGIFIDSLDTHGYVSSNRQHGGYDDDIYEFDMDLQTYPVAINGVVKYKEHTWSDTSALEAMPHATIFLIDNLRDEVVGECRSNDRGHFYLTVPYFSNYIIRVIDKDNNENRVVLEIPKHRKQLSAHEIVIIKDIFQPTKSQEK